MFSNKPQNNSQSSSTQGLFNKGPGIFNQSPNPVFQNKPLFQSGNPSAGSSSMIFGKPNNQQSSQQQHTGQNSLFAQGGQSQQQQQQRNIKVVINPIHGQQQQQQQQQKVFTNNFWSNNQPQNQQPNQAGIFGNKNQPQQQQQANSMFGPNGTNKQQGGLFNQSSTSSGGLFNSSQKQNTAQPQQNVFGFGQSTQNPSGNPFQFGQQTSTQQQQQPQQPQLGSIFSNLKTSTNQTTSFGQVSSGQQSQKTGIFSNISMTGQQQQQQQPQQQSGIFGNIMGKGQQSQQGSTLQLQSQPLVQNSTNWGQGLLGVQTQSQSSSTPKQSGGQSSFFGVSNGSSLQNLGSSNPQQNVSSTQNNNSQSVWGSSGSGQPMFNTPIQQQSTQNDAQPINFNSPSYFAPQTVSYSESSKVVDFDSEVEVNNFTLFPEKSSHKNSNRLSDSYSTDDSFNSSNFYDHMEFRNSFFAKPGKRMMAKYTPTQATMLPRTRKYTITPSMDDLAMMTDNELSHLEGFIIENKHVQVVFRGPVDLRNADLDSIFTLGPKSLEINNDANTENPKAFKQPAQVTFFNWEIPSKYVNQKEKFLGKLHDWVESFGGTFVDYDEDRGNLHAFIEFN